MSRRLELFFDYVSPFSYLAARQLPVRARGVFGAPTFCVEGEMYFGNDRLDFVEEALRA